MQRFPATGGKWQISNGGGVSAHWRRDGHELFYLWGDKLMAVEVNGSGDMFQAGIPRQLFEFRVANRQTGPHYAVTIDGQRFLVNTQVESTLPNSPVTVVTNWAADLKR